jgi:hypothetical protein
MASSFILRKLNADYLGIASSALCVVHCVLSPFIVATISALKTSEEGWAWLDYVFIALCLWAVFHSTKHSYSKPIKMGLWVVWAVFAIGIVFEEAAEGMAYVGYVGSLGLVVLHILNMRHFKRCEKCAH